ncbi:MAG TPA: hypothetical protein VFU48_02290 [Nitrospira sp.]|nr:hypothetical protein [Nitrospira sp.]
MLTPPVAADPKRKSLVGDKDRGLQWGREGDGRDDAHDYDST